MKEKLFSKQECEKLIEYAESLDTWRTWRTEQFSYSNVIFAIDGSYLIPVRDFIYRNTNLKVKNISFGMFRYTIGDYFSRHIDRNPNIEINKDFVYNINVKLNTNYSGGEFYLNGKEYTSGIGDVYIYPSTQYHEVKQIKQGVRYQGLFYLRERDISHYNLENKSLL